MKTSVHVSRLTSVSGRLALNQSVKKTQVQGSTPGTRIPSPPLMCIGAQASATNKSTQQAKDDAALREAQLPGQLDASLNPYQSHIKLDFYVTVCIHRRDTKLASEEQDF